MVGYQVAKATVKGDKPLTANKPNQDACDSLTVGEFKILALSDGHGSEKYTFSHLGANYAVTVALEVFREYLQHISKETTLDQIQFDIEERLSMSLQAKWINEILKDPNFQSIEQFGCTLLVAILSPEWIATLQIGDGKIAVVYESGDVYFPTARDDRFSFSETASMIQENAWIEMKVTVSELNEKVRLLGLSSDGVENAYPSGFYDDVSFYRELASSMALEETLNSLVQTASQYSHDDTTAIVCYNDELLKSPFAESIHTWFEQMPMECQPFLTSLIGGLNKRIEAAINLEHYFQKCCDLLPRFITLKRLFLDSEEAINTIGGGDRLPMSSERILQLIQQLVGISFMATSRKDIKERLIELQRSLRYDYKQCKYIFENGYDKVAPTVSFKGANGTYELFHNSYIYLHQILPMISSVDFPVGKVVQHPKNPRIWGIQNLSNISWETEREQIFSGKTLTIKPRTNFYAFGIPIQLEIKP
ncbi:MAG: hypothetical protein BGO41_08440 [Clostridiales bacterium 38-18]|mgnify:CR=1 FL=1|nr:MAG: hypothetical protein BGO41_08440 [Clostridiales bacterium 38-18]